MMTSTSNESTNQIQTSARHRVWLSVISPTIQPEQVSTLLGLTPSKMYVKGSPVPRHVNGIFTGRIADFNKWTMQVNVDASKSLEEHLAELGNLLQPSTVSSLKQLSQNATVLVEIEVINEAGITLPKSFIQVLAKCGGTVDIDVRD
jgi:hypothetical protein